MVSLFKSHVNKKGKEVLRISHVYTKTTTKTTEKDLLEMMLNSWKNEVNTILIPSFYPKHIPTMHL